MKFLPLILAPILFGAFAQTASAMAISEVAELQFHKVDQLVSTRKIDVGFVEHLASVSLTKEKNGPNFLVTFQQEADKDQAAIAVVVKADAKGKAQGYTLASGKLAAAPANWGGKSPLDILEKGVEYVVDSTNDPLTPKFRDGLTSASIEPLTSENGLQALVKVMAGPADGTLLVTLDLNGKILSSAKQ